MSETEVTVKMMFKGRRIIKRIVFRNFLKNVETKEGILEEIKKMYPSATDIEIIHVAERNDKTEGW
jgi:hypothetical protein